MLIVVGVCCSWIGIHHAMSAYEQSTYPPLGELVEVDGGKMHVYTKGEGENTIVLLSGAGTAAPAIDYAPLMDELSRNNRVVVIEPFGYGWSDVTDKERTVENIVEEMREALQQARIEGPYILMPHSISGIYSMYYANTYPNEVKAVIGIDSTLPQALQYFGESAPTMPSYVSAINPTGIGRLIVNMNTDKYLPIADQGTYSEDQLKEMERISTWKLGNKNVVDEVNELSRTIDKTIDMSFPPEIPVMMFTKKDDKVTEDGKTTVSFYETQVNKVSVLEGHHYLHWSRYKEMNETVNEFIKTAL
jgi:pimeloyl-ACP methyl ester carboxylesterase